jgi:hypothetical protein
MEKISRGLLSRQLLLSRYLLGSFTGSQLGFSDFIAVYFLNNKSMSVFLRCSFEHLQMKWHYCDLPQMMLMSKNNIAHF